MTTRESRVAFEWKDLSGCHYIYDLQPLHEKEAWELFCRRSFEKGICPSELEQLSYEMMRKCEGLPLAIVAIAGLLSTKPKKYSEWMKLHACLGFELGNNRYFSSTAKVLLMSYHELPYHLKSCFLYLGMFPRDYFISYKRLVRLWIAEGFIPNQHGKTLEEVAEECLVDLVNRNLVLVCEFDSPSERPRTKFRVHDILREMIIVPKLDNLGFCQVIPENSNAVTNNHFRRLSVHHSDYATNSDVSEVINSVTRSLLWFSNNLLEPCISSLLKDAHLLRVLDLEDAPISDIPEEVGNLKLLQYLSLRNTKVKMLPKRIGELCYLQTLDLKHCPIVQLPNEIGSCHKLRHLLLVHPKEHLHLRAHCLWYQKKKKKGVKIQQGVLKNFKDLQNLACVDAADMPGYITELKQLNKLRRLEITNLRKECGRDLCCAIDQMTYLKSLSVQSIPIEGEDEYEILDLQYINNPLFLLEHLYLGGPLENFPEWILLPNLSKLDLAHSRLEEKAIVFLISQLPNLEDVSLYKAHKGENISSADDNIFSGCEEYFPPAGELWISSTKLKVAILYGLHFNKLRIHLPQCRTLLIDDFRNLDEVMIAAGDNMYHASNDDAINRQTIFFFLAG